MVPGTSSTMALVLGLALALVAGEGVEDGELVLQLQVF